MSRLSHSRTSIISEQNNGRIILEGYLLKKKQKKMQGFARRYFRLYSSGTLTYAVTDTDNVRDHVNLRSSVWLSHNNRRTVTIDGGTSTWHIKFTSGEEYVNWMKTLRIFLDPTPPAVPLETVAENAQRPPIENINKSIKLIDLIEFDLTNLKNGQNQVRTPPSSRSREQLHSSSSHQGGLLNIFHKSPKLNSSSDDLFDTQPHRAYDAIFERLLDSTNDLKRLQQELHNMHSTQEFDTVNSRTFNNASRYAPSRTSSVNDFEFYDAQDTFGEAYEFEDADEEDEGNDDVHDDEEDVDKEAVYDGVESSLGPHDSKYGLMQLPRRPQLPARISGDEIGLLGVLKKNVGKDLTTISFPVSFNEPLSLLQKVAEDFEYVDLINKAIQSKSSIEKMACIAAFCVSSYSCTQYRSTRKPFNPLLGETYEYITPQFAFFSEKVTHHPPLVAAYAQGDGWSFVATSGVKQKFWGKSMEIIPIGNAKLTLKSTGDVYTWRKPSSFIRNLVMSSPYLEHTGDLDIKNETTGETSTIAFKEGSFFGGEASRGFVEGFIDDKDKKRICKLSGRWSQNFVRHLLDDDGKSTDRFQKLWESNNQFPPDCQDYYGFSKHAVKLNELVNEKVLPPTDTRFRPDQRSLEEGDANTADNYKNTLEQSQRERRNQIKGYDQSRVRWFKKINNDEWVPILNEKTNEPVYFEKRARVSDNQDSWSDNDNIFKIN